jgi:fructose-1-phosphate kinase PfkB-like protein
MIQTVKRRFPQTLAFATTLRQVVSTERPLWGAILLEGHNWHVVEPREITVLDRIGGGDGFVGGMLYGIRRGWEPAKWVQFGWATGAVARAARRIAPVASGTWAAGRRRTTHPVGDCRVVSYLPAEGRW